MAVTQFDFGNFISGYDSGRQSKYNRKLEAEHNEDREYLLNVKRPYEQKIQELDLALKHGDIDDQSYRRERQKIDDAYADAEREYKTGRRATTDRQQDTRFANEQTDFKNRQDDWMYSKSRRATTDRQQDTRFANDQTEFQNRQDDRTRNLDKQERSRLVEVGREAMDALVRAQNPKDWNAGIKLFIANNNVSEEDAKQIFFGFPYVMSEQRQNMTPEQLQADFTTHKKKVLAAAQELMNDVEMDKMRTMRKEGLDPRRGSSTGTYRHPLGPWKDFVAINSSLKEQYLQDNAIPDGNQFKTDRQGNIEMKPGAPSFEDYKRQWVREYLSYVGLQPVQSGENQQTPRLMSMIQSASSENVEQIAAQLGQMEQAQQDELIKGLVQAGKQDVAEMALYMAIEPGFAEEAEKWYKGAIDSPSPVSTKNGPTMKQPSRDETLMDQTNRSAKKLNQYMHGGGFSEDIGNAAGAVNRAVDEIMTNPQARAGAVQGINRFLHGKRLLDSK